MAARVESKTIIPVSLLVPVSLVPDGTEIQLNPDCHRSPADISERLDRLIEQIREKWHAPVMGKQQQQQQQQEEGSTGDVLIVAHGHILRAFAQRWARQSFEGGPTFLLEAGGLGTLR